MADASETQPEVQAEVEQEAEPEEEPEPEAAAEAEAPEAEAEPHIEADPSDNDNVLVDSTEITIQPPPSASSDIEDYDGDISQSQTQAPEAVDRPEPRTRSERSRREMSDAFKAPTRLEAVVEQSSVDNDEEAKDDVFGPTSKTILRTTRASRRRSRANKVSELRPLGSSESMPSSTRLRSGGPALWKSTSMPEQEADAAEMVAPASPSPARSSSVDKEAGFEEAAEGHEPTKATEEVMESEEIEERVAASPEPEPVPATTTRRSTKKATSGVKRKQARRSRQRAAASQIPEDIIDLTQSPEPEDRPSNSPEDEQEDEPTRIEDSQVIEVLDEDEVEKGAETEVETEAESEAATEASVNSASEVYRPKRSSSRPSLLSSARGWLQRVNSFSLFSPQPPIRVFVEESPQVEVQHHTVKASEEILKNNADKEDPAAIAEQAEERIQDPVFAEAEPKQGRTRLGKKKSSRGLRSRRSKRIHGDEDSREGSFTSASPSVEAHVDANADDELRLSPRKRKRDEEGDIDMEVSSPRAKARATSSRDEAPSQTQGRYDGKLHLPPGEAGHILIADAEETLLQAMGRSTAARAAKGPAATPTHSQHTPAIPPTPSVRPSAQRNILRMVEQAAASSDTIHDMDLEGVLALLRDVDTLRSAAQANLQRRAQAQRAASRARRNA